MTPETLSADGWVRVAGSGFTQTLGPLWVRGQTGERTLGFLTSAEHCNNDPATVHGGALMTFADLALGFRAAELLRGKACVTAQLQLQFVARARIGEFVTCEAELVRCTTSLAFVRGLLRAGEQTVASADGIWKILESKSRQ